jgi:SulP family sulfate permease
MSAPIFAVALRRAMQLGYVWKDLRSDAMAGTVVGVVALPLSMALAIASGVPPQHGLYTAIVAGSVVALLGGSKVQVTGPTAAFVAVLVPISTRFGLGGLLMATLMAGVLLVVMGAVGLGRLIEFVPHPVTTGFTAGIAVVIATLQLKDFLGLTTGPMPEHYIDRLGVLLAAVPSAHTTDMAVGTFTLAVLILWPRLDRRIPGTLVALVLAGVTVFLLERYGHGFHAETINSRFGGIPQIVPQPALPWHSPGPNGHPLGLSLALVRALLPAAFAIAVLGAIESLLSAVVADGMTGKKHHPDGELMAQGIGNIVAPFFGGFAATGAIARTAANIRSGARSPLAAAFHALLILLAIVAAAPLLGFLPMASLAALLLLVAWNMAEAELFLKTLRTAPRGDVLVLITCFGLTVVFDMVVAVTAGIVLSALMFIREMAEVSGVKLVGSEDRTDLPDSLPRGVLLYEVAGPLFFGAAQKAVAAIERTDRRGVRIVILDVTAVPAMDATGLVALQSLVARMNDRGVKVILAGVQPQPLRTFARAGWRNRKGRLRIFRSLERGVSLARRSAAALSPARTD